MGLIRNVVNDVSDEAWAEVYERALERIDKMSYLEFFQNVSGSDQELLDGIVDRVAEAMTEDFIQTGEW